MICQDNRKAKYPSKSQAILFTFINDKKNSNSRSKKKKKKENGRRRKEKTLNLSELLIVFESIKIRILDKQFSFDEFKKKKKRQQKLSWT